MFDFKFIWSCKIVVWFYKDKLDCYEIVEFVLYFVVLYCCYCLLWRCVMSLFDVLFKLLLIGVGVMFLMDLWMLFWWCVFGILLFDYVLVGCWFGYMMYGWFCYVLISVVVFVVGECVFGWIVYYVIGIVFVVLFVLIVGLMWIDVLMLFFVFVVGFVSVVVLFFVM